MEVQDISNSVFGTFHDYDVDEDEDVEVEETTDDDIESDVETTNEVETTPEPAEPEYEEFEVPEYIPDDLIPPEKFDSTEAELEWYKDNYVKSMELTKDPKFLDYVLSTYKEELDKLEEQSVERILADNNIVELKARYPQLLGKAGVDATFSEEDKIAAIDNHLKNTYGNNYKDKFDKTEAADPNSISGRMLAEQEKVINWVENRNQEIVQQLQQMKPPTQEEINQRLDNEYKEFADSNFTRDEFNEFYKEAQEYSPKVNMKDMHRMMNFDDYMQEAYNKGMNEGRKSVGKEIEKVGRQYNGNSVNGTSKKIINKKDDFNPFNPGGQSVFNPFKKEM